MSDVQKKIDNPGRFKTGHKPSEETKKKYQMLLQEKLFPACEAGETKQKKQRSPASPACFAGRRDAKNP